MSLVFPAELGWAAVTNQVTSLVGPFPFFDELLRFMQFERLGVLQW